MTTSTFKAAKTICDLSEWKISNLPLQKLLYLAHMVYLGNNHAPLVDGQFQAWELGPVEPSLYHKIKAYGSHPIVDIFPCDILDSNTEEFKCIKLTYDSLKNAAPGQLVAMTHWDGGAWAKNYKPNAYGVLISNSDILDEYNERMRKS